MTANKSTNAEAIANQLDAHTKELENRISSFKARKEALEARHQNILDRQNKLVEDHGGSNISPMDMIHLNVGGTEMYARRNTLTAVKGSRLEALFSGRWEKKLLRDVMGRVFMDLDPDVFKMLLNHLLKMKLAPDVDPCLENMPQNNLFKEYVEFLAVSTAKVDSEQVESKESSQGILDVISNEDAFLQKLESELDEMEERVDAEESFVRYFTTDSDKNSVGEDSGSEFSFSDVSTDTKTANKVCQPKDASQGKSQSDEERGIMNLLIENEIVSVKTSTICLYPNSKLAKIFTDEVVRQHSIIMRDNMRLYAIDMPHTAFDLILNELRMRAMKIRDDCPINIETLEPFEVESITFFVKYYLENDMEIATDFDNSVILTNEAHRVQLRRWLAKVGHPNIPKLLFRVSRDDISVSEFHKRCGYQGSTIIVAKTKEEGSIIGGYSDTSKSDYYGICDYTSYGRSLTCHDLNRPWQYKFMNTTREMFSSKGWIPRFATKDPDGFFIMHDTSKLCYYNINEYSRLSSQDSIPLLDYEVYKI